jgi:hypothetical protein
MFVRGITLSIAAIFTVGLMAEAANAEHDRRKPRRIIIEDGYYPGPPIIREIPGLRILFGDYALSAEEFDELYGTPRRAYRYYDEEPEPRKPKRKAREQEQQQQKPKSKTAAKPAKPAETGTAKKTTTKTAAAAPLSCEKATSVVTGYGFSSVTPSTCSGKVYAFNATRDGKSFAIKLDPANGELTEVKKLP